MKVSTSIWVAALASWGFAGAARAEGGAAVVAAPVVAIPVAAVAATPVVVPTQEVLGEAGPAEAPVAVVPAVVAPVVAAPVVVPIIANPVVAASATVEPAGTVSAVAPPPVAAPAAAPAPAPASRDGLADPFATPSVWSTNGSQPAAAATAPAVESSAAALPIAPQSPYPGSGHYHPRRPEDYRLGVGMMFGGGITDFASPMIRDMTGTGGAWDVRLIFGQREVLALETAYIGSAHYISALGLDQDAMLVSNGAEGTLRLNIPVIDHGSIIEPFGFVGLGWSRYELTQTAYNRSNITTAENVMEVPYGCGLTMGSDGFLVDIRFTYRATYYDQLMRTPTSSGSTGGDNRLNSWSLGAHIGFEF
jgi:hypothetical protein